MRKLICGNEHIQHVRPHSGAFSFLQHSWIQSRHASQANNEGKPKRPLVDIPPTSLQRPHIFSFPTISLPDISLLTLFPRLAIYKTHVWPARGSSSLFGCVFHDMGRTWLLRTRGTWYCVKKGFLKEKKKKKLTIRYFVETKYFLKRF